MKKMILASVLMSVVSSVSFAGELCGTLGTHTVAPVCNPGQACPMWLRLQYDLTTNEGTRYDLETSTMGVLSNSANSKGTKFASAVLETRTGFEVVSISKN